MRTRSPAAIIGVLLFTLATGALGQISRPFVVKDIRVEGLQRTEPGTVFSYLPVKVGETMTEEKAQQALRALFATGFFRDVRLGAENVVLVVLVEERPALAQIDFVGVKEFELDNLRRIMRDVGLADGRTFDRAVLDRAEQELKRQYLSRGRYAAEVQTTMLALGSLARISCAACTPSFLGMVRSRVMMSGRRARNIRTSQRTSPRIRSARCVFRTRDSRSRTPAWRVRAPESSIGLVSLCPGIAEHG